MRSARAASSFCTPARSVSPPSQCGRSARRSSRKISARPVAAANVLPSSGRNSVRAIEVEGTPTKDPANPPAVDHRLVTSSYLQTMRIPMGQGRDFDASDDSDGQPVAIIARSAAALYFPAADAIGGRIKVGSSPWLTVVGVSDDIIHDWFSRRNAPTVYRPYAQAPSSSCGIRGPGRRRPGGLDPRRARRREDRRSRPGHLRRAADRGDALRAHDRPAVRRRDHGGFWSARARPRCRRCLQPDGLHHHPGHARDRRPDCARRPLP
ncbi:MAG: ABC transporter permease [Acidobacteria bacterium]|nr:ABC transporter permease [Acidobacteriota bacterium]